MEPLPNTTSPWVEDCPMPQPGDPLYKAYGEYGAHGTLVSGAVAALANNGLGVAGAAQVSGTCAARAPRWRRGAARCGRSATLSQVPASAPPPGCAPQVPLFACRAFSSNGLTWASSELDCYALCRQSGARVVSASFRNYHRESQLAKGAIAGLGAAGALFVACAGNEARDNDALPADQRCVPSSYGLPNQITVAASVWGDELAPWSNYGR